MQFSDQSLQFLDAESKTLIEKAYLGPVLEMNVSESPTKHKFYCYVWVNADANTKFLRGEILFLSNKSQVHSLPWLAGGTSPILAKSYASFCQKPTPQPGIATGFVYSTSGASDVRFLWLANFDAAEISPVPLPSFEVNRSIDNIKLVILENTLTTTTSCRFYIGCEGYEL